MSEFLCRNCRFAQPHSVVLTEQQFVIASKDLHGGSIDPSKLRATKPAKEIFEVGNITRKCNGLRLWQRKKVDLKAKCVNLKEYQPKHQEAPQRGRRSIIAK